MEFGILYRNPWQLPSIYAAIRVPNQMILSSASLKDSIDSNHLKIQKTYLGLSRDLIFISWKSWKSWRKGKGEPQHTRIFSISCRLHLVCYARVKFMWILTIFFPNGKFVLDLFLEHPIFYFASPAKTDTRVALCSHPVSWCLPSSCLFTWGCLPST